MRYLGIDLGDKRTGLAIADTELRLAVPLTLLETPINADGGKQLINSLVQEIATHLGGPRSPGEVVIGLPLNMDGSDSPRATHARAFAAVIAERTGRCVHLQDERLTTAAADWSLAQSGLTHKQKKERRDAIAAAAMLQEFVNRLG